MSTTPNIQKQHKIKKTNRKSHTYSDMYETYKKKDAIEKGLFLKVLKVFFALLAKSIIEKGYIYKMPQGLGAIGIMKHYVGDKKIMDYPHYRRTGEKRYTNFSIKNPFIGFWKWFKHKPFCYMQDKNLFKFTPTRANKKHLAKWIKEENGLLDYWS